MARAEQLCQAIRALGVEHGGQWLGIGASVGVVELDAVLAPLPADWIACADAACYRAKSAGRGQACLGQLQRPAEALRAQPSGHGSVPGPVQVQVPAPVPAPVPVPASL